MAETKDGTVKATGASAGDVLMGINKLNMNLRIAITKDQSVGRGGRILGDFKILDAGSGTYSEYVKKLEGHTFSNAKDVIEQVQQMSGKSCSHILNCNNFKVAS